MKALLAAHAASTLVMVGVILTIQVVHYPLFSGVGAEGFSAYEAAHARRITWIVLPVMLVELATAAALVYARPAWFPLWLAWLGLALVVLIWLSTAFLQVPQHTILTRGFDAAAHARLVGTNWIRTTLWLVRGGLVVWMMARG